MFNKLYVKIKDFIKENYVFLISMLLIIFLFYYELPFVIYKSGGTIPLDNRIEIAKEYKEDGSLSMSYVTTLRGTLPMILLSYVIPDWDLVSVKSITNGGDFDEVINIEKEYLDEGIDNAIIAAFRESSYGIEITRTINKVIYLSDMAQTDIEIGDEIISINDKEVNSIEEMKDYINTLKEGEKVDILVNQDGEEKLRNAIIYKDELGDLKVGVSFKTRYEYKTPIEVKVKMKKNESGSSGGLMMSLAIYNALTDEDITHGLNIVGTGTIDSDGNVGEIGGIKYKILGANKKKTDIFFCPKENYEEAMQIKNKYKLKLNIVSVGTLKEAISYLNSRK